MTVIFANMFAVRVVPKLRTRGWGITIPAAEGVVILAWDARDCTWLSSACFPRFLSLSSEDKRLHLGLDCEPMGQSPDTTPICSETSWVLGYHWELPLSWLVYRQKRKHT